MNAATLRKVLFLVENEDNAESEGEDEEQYGRRKATPEDPNRRYGEAPQHEP